MPWNETKPGLRFPAWSSPPIVVLVLSIVVCSVVAAGTIFYRLGLAQEALGGRQQEMTLWATFQLDRESRKMDDALRTWRNGDTPFEDVTTRLEILISRIDYLREGDFARSGAFRAREVALVGEIGPLIQQLEDQIGTLPAKPDRVAAVLDARHVVHEIEKLTAPLLNIVSQDGAEARSRIRADSEALFIALGLASFVLVAAVALALAAVLTQNATINLARRRAEAIGEELRRTAIAAQAASRAKATFLATMSHEIRTPMNGVLGAASLLGASQITQEQHRHVEMIAACGRALLALIDDILDFSKLEAGRTEFAISAFSPQDLLQAVADICAPMVRDRGLYFVAVVSPALAPELRSDPQRLRQVLVNLVSNAVKFTEDGSVLVILDLEPGADGRPWLHAIVADTGVGIGPEILGGLFHEFEQGDPAIGRRFGGTGLGLAICKRIVESLGGRIGVESEPGRGSRFWFRVPITTEHPPHQPMPRGPAFVQAPPGPLAPAMEALLRASGYTVTDTAAPDSLVLLHVSQIEHVMPRGARVIRFGPGAPLAPPVTAASLTLAVDGETTGPEPAPPAPILPPMRLLVAEDNAMNRDVMQQVLAAMGHDVELAADGADALERVQNGAPFDAVLLDLQMPVLDGISAARAIRALPPPAGRTLLLAVTANAMPSDRDACLAAGMNGFLAKPVTIARLTAALRELMLGLQPDEPAPPSSATIDTDHRQSLLAALRPGSLERLVMAFWEEIGLDIAALAPDVADAQERDERLHRLAGAAATLGYAQVSQAALAMRNATTPDIAPLLAALRAALAYDAALLPGTMRAAARTVLD